MAAPLTVHVFSFGFKFSGPPKDESAHGGGFVFDCRALPNPFWDTAVRAYSGIEPPVVAWLDKEPEVREFAELTARLVLYTARTYAKLGRAEQAGQQYEDALRRSTDQEQMARLKGKLQALRNVGSASH